MSLYAEYRYKQVRKDYLWALAFIIFACLVLYFLLDAPVWAAVILYYVLDARAMARLARKWDK